LFLLKPGIRVTPANLSFNETTDHECRSVQQLNATNLDGLILDMRRKSGGLP